MAESGHDATVVTEGGGSVVYLVWGHAQSEQWGLLEERGPSGELVGRYVHGAGIDELVAGMSAGGMVVYYHQYHLNSTVAVTDESGALVEQYRYDVFGKPFFLAPDGTPRAESAYGIRFLFTGREWLAPLGLYDYRHRAYSPTLGRFLQVDPVGSERHNAHLYDYCGNGPFCSRDPWGLSPRDVVRLREMFDASVEQMVRSGRRLDGRGRWRANLNNFTHFLQSLVPGCDTKKYLCTDQARYVIREFLRIKATLDDCWEVEEVNHNLLWIVPIPWHVSLRFRSRNSRDPVIEADPWVWEWKEVWPSAN